MAHGHSSAARHRTCVETGADIARLVFEVTEAHAFPDLKLLRRILDRYRAQGARVALDDMGSGHTSLLYLSALQPDYVKLDRGLLSGLSPDDPRVPLLGAMIRYAHDLGIRVIAEGVESRAELEISYTTSAPTSPRATSSPAPPRAPPASPPPPAATSTTHPLRPPSPADNRGPSRTPVAGAAADSA